MPLPSGDLPIYRARRAQEPGCFQKISQRPAVKALSHFHGCAWKEIKANREAILVAALAVGVAYYQEELGGALASVVNQFAGTSLGKSLAETTLGQKLNEYYTWIPETQEPQGWVSTLTGFLGF